MGSANVELAREYLRAVESMGPPENVSRFYSNDIEFHEFPNRIVPHGRVRRRPDLQAAYGQAQKLLSSQRYEVRRVVENGDEVAVELEWTGVLAMAVPAMDLPAGHEMKAYVAMFLTFRDGKIVSQRNYDCYPPFEAAVSSAAGVASAASAPKAGNGNG
jgi:ketosteroid isomerase-like protein